MNELRDSFAILNVGAKRTGKTTQSLKMMMEFAEKQNKPSVVLDLSNHSAFANFKQITLNDLPRIHEFVGKKYFVFRPSNPMYMDSEVMEFCLMMTQYVRNSVGFFEDFTTYLEGNFHPVIKKMILNSRNNCNDYIFNVHSFGDVGPFALKHCEIYIVRHSADDPNDLPNKIPYSVRGLVSQALKEVNRENKHLAPDEPHLASRTILKDELRILR